MKQFWILMLFPIFIFFIPREQPAVPKEIMTRGKAVYDQACLSCHMPNGMGVPRMAPSLVKSPYVLGTKTKMIRIVLKGSEEFPQNDDRYFTNPMTPILHLTDQQIADVLTYIRNSYGNRASIITPGDVRYVKARMK